MAVINTNLVCDLQKAVKVEYIDGVLFSQDNQANQINVTVLDGGEPATISGDVSANIVRSDGGTVAATGGSITDNIASITLPAAAYAVPGVVSIVVKLTASGVVTTIAALVANMYRTSTDTAIDPGTVIPSIQTLIAQIDAAVASIPADYSSLWTKLAPAFSTDASYVAGQYVTYNSGLYRFNTTHTGDWSSSDVTAVNLGGEITDLKSAFNYSLIGINKGEISIGDAGGYYNVSTGDFVANTSTLDATLKFPVVPGMKVEAQVTGEKYYLFWNNAGVFISEGSGRLDNGEKTVPSSAAFCAIDYLTAKGTPITVKTSYQITESVQKNTADIVELDNRVDAIEAGTIYAKAVGWWWYITTGVKVYDTSSFTGTEQIKVSGYDTIKETKLGGEKYYVFWDGENAYISFERSDTGYVNIPDNAVYCALDFQTSQGATSVLFELNKNDKEEGITCVRNGNTFQIKTKLRNTSKYIGLNASLVDRENQGFNMLKYVITSTKPKVDETITGTTYKYADDDICPVHYNGSYMGGNHGKEPVYKIVCTNHGKTTSDIGSVWTDANGHDYVIYKIDDDNNFSVVGDYENTYAGIIISVPTSPLTHKTGATHTGNVVFSSATSQQLRPITNNKSVKIRNDKYEELTKSGYITGRYIEIIESYRILSVGAIIAYLKNHVGSCDNSSYYNDNIADSILIQNVFRFSEGGGESVCVSITPLESVQMDYFGGVQSIAIGNDFFVPFTQYKTITTQDSNTVNLDSSKWDDVDFPPYKYYQLNGNDGFAVGYCIDTAQALPESRKQICSQNAGFYYGSSHKVYPMFYYKSEHPAVSSGCFCFYAFRAPFEKSGNKIDLWYETADATYMEIELFNSWSGIINLPDHVLGKTIEVVKKTDSITIPSNIINTGSCYVKCTGTGSITLKFN